MGFYIDIRRIETANPILDSLNLEAPADDRPTISLVVVGHVDAGYFLACLKHIWNEFSG